MFKSKDYHFDLGSNNTVAAEVTSKIILVLLTKNGTEINLKNMSLEGVKNQLKNTLNSALASSSLSDHYTALESVFSSLVSEEDELKSMYASFSKEQEEAEQLAMAARQFSSKKFNFIDLSYVAARMMALTFLKAHGNEVIEEAFDFSPESFESLLERARQVEQDNKPLSDKCLHRLCEAVADSMEYVKTSA